MSAAASSSSSGVPVEPRKSPGTVSRGRLGAFTSARKGLTQQFASQDRPKPTVQASEQPPTWIKRELWAIKETFFNHNTTSLLAINFLIAFVPLGFAAGMLGWGPLSTFGFNFLAIIPLASILGASTEALSTHTGQVVGGLMNASLGNAVEMCVTICAIQNGLVKVVQMSLIGSVLSNLLLVLGMSFIAAGLRAHESQFNSAGASSSITCLVLASLALTLPTVFTSIPGSTEEDALMLSRIIACVMAFVYVSFLFFQLGTHATLFRASQKEEEEQKNGEEGTHQLSLWTALFFLLSSTISVVYCSDYLVKSIQGVSEHYGMPYAFIGLILLPIVGNAAEHTTAVTAAYHDMMDLAMGVAVGSSTQIALFVIPFSVLIGWWSEVPLSLDFEIFSTTVFLLSVFIASGVLSDGCGNWFEGLMLCATYAIVAIITWFIPDSEHVHARELSGLGAESALSSAVPFLSSFQEGQTLVI